MSEQDYPSEDSAGEPAPTVVTVVIWDAETDQAIVRHDGEQVWTDPMGSFDQYLRHYAPKGVPIVLELAEE